MRQSGRPPRQQLVQAHAAGWQERGARPACLACLASLASLARLARFAGPGGALLTGRNQTAAVDVQMRGAELVAARQPGHVENQDVLEVGDEICNKYYIQY